MLLSIACISASVLFAFSVRKRKDLISALIAIESVVIIAMLAVTVLSAVGGGNNNVYLQMLANAICGKVSVFGLSVSSLMLIQAIVVLLVCFISLYFIYRVVKKAFKSTRPALNDGCAPEDAPVYKPCGYSKRKVFLLYCRMNN